MKHVIISGCFLLIASLLSGQNNPWTSFSESAIPITGEKRIVPQKYHTFQLDQSVLQSQLAAAREKGEISLRNSPFTIQLPQPNGGSQAYLLAYAPVMAPALAAKYPEISTYVIQGIDDPHARGRLDWTPAGFHGMIMSSAGTVYIDPLQTADNRHYQAYYKKDFIANNQGIIPACEPLDYDPTLKKEMQELLLQKSNAQVNASPSGTNLRTYRTAVAATGEYTQFHGGTVASGQAAIVTAINRVTGIYEVEVSCRLELVANNDLLVYTDGSTDPYSNNNGGALLGQNQTNCDNVIGNSNYDIGHVFNTGGGGLAALGVVCNNNNKARGQTGLSSPTGDPFYVDYVAHEIGHQFAGNHTFNGSAGSCTGGNRNGSTAYEPGSGSTIQAYAGICGSHNIANRSDDYFHTLSFDEMVTYTTQSTGNNCPNTTGTGNSVPVPNAGGGGYTIPINTPFELTGTATDADGDPLTYNWEQFDLGPAGHPNNPSGNAPIFRSFPASTSPTRTFPQTSDLLNNTQTIGEILPSYGRNLTFRMTVRDNRADGGGVDYQQISMSVDASAGPFLVTAPNTNVLWTGLSSETVTWDVANTTGGSVNCANVDILLSTDGGITFPTVVLSNTPNDGSQNITVPDVVTTQARIKVKCSTNVFFDLSDTDFEVQAGNNFTLAASPTSQTICAGNSASFNVTIGQLGNYDEAVTLSAPSAPGTVFFDPNGEDAPYNSVMVITGATVGTYNFDIEGISLGITKTTPIELVVINSTPTSPTLFKPVNNAVDVDLSPNFLWSPITGALDYDIEIATDGSFNNIVHQATVASNTYSGATLSGSTNYFWRVIANNDCGGGPASAVSNFTTTLGPLPVELVALKAQAVGKVIQVDWTTVEELDNRGFEVERSVSPERGFEKVAWVAAKEFTSLENAYRFVDERVIADVVYYYRLRQLDFSGQATYSEVVSASIAGDGPWDLHLQPNPAREWINIVSIGNSRENVDLLIYDINGRVIYQLNSSLRSAGDQERIDLSELAAGVYILRGKAAGEEVIKRLIVR